MVHSLAKCSGLIHLKSINYHINKNSLTYSQNLELPYKTCRPYPRPESRSSFFSTCLATLRSSTFYKNPFHDSSVLLAQNFQFNLLGGTVLTDTTGLEASVPADVDVPGGRFT